LYINVSYLSNYFIYFSILLFFYIRSDTLTHDTLDKIERENQYYFDFQKNNLHATLNAQYNFEETIKHFLDTNDLSYTSANVSINFLNEEISDDNNEVFSSTLRDEEINEFRNDEVDFFKDEDSVVYLYSIRPNTMDESEEDWS
jgi:hypothetical protein